MWSGEGGKGSHRRRSRAECGMWRTASVIATVAVLMSMLSWLASVEPAPSAIASSDADTMAHGRRLFAHNCSPCHGQEAVGENPATPMGGWTAQVGHLAPALNGTGHAWHHPPEYLFHTIRHGSTVKGSRMQGWAQRMSDYDIVAVMANFQFADGQSPGAEHRT